MLNSPDIDEKYDFVAEKLKRARSIARNCAVVCFIAIMIIYVDSFLIPLIPIVMIWGIMAIITYSLASIAELNALQNKIENFWPLRIATHIALWIVGSTVALCMIVSISYFPILSMGAALAYENIQYESFLSLIIVIALSVFSIFYGYKYFLCHTLILQALGKMVEIRRQDRQAGSPQDGNPAGQPT